MSLSKIDKNHMEGLLTALNNNHNNLLESIKNNHVHYSRLKQIDKQIKQLKIEALDIIKDSEFQNELHNLGSNFKLVSGNVYYLYEKEKSQSESRDKYFSLIAPSEWNNKDLFIGLYLYDYDKQFVLQE